MKKAILQSLTSDRIWPVVATSGAALSRVPMGERVFQRLLFERVVRQREWIERFISEQIADATVCSGPLAGLIYPTLSSAGSTLAPKLLGSYENEIAEYFQPPQLRRYDTIVDVGCAEGYYAVGAARSNSDARVVAFDISATARDLCRKLAEANGVADRVEISTACGTDELKAFCEPRTLVLSDCEGFEMELFTEDSIGALHKADCVIEVHPHLGADLSELVGRFEATHQCGVIHGRMDRDRLRMYTHPAVDHLPVHQRIVLFAECRSRGNCWLVAKTLWRPEKEPPA